MTSTALFAHRSAPSEPVEASAKVAAGRWESAFVCLALFLSTSALLPLLFDPGSVAGTSTAASPNDPLSRLAWLLILGSLLVALTRVGSEVVAAVSRNPMIAGLCYLAVTSTLWSAVPGTTLKYSFELTFSTLLGLYAGVRFGLARIVAMVSWTTAVILFLSVVFALLLPRYGLDHERGNVWRGIFTTKNELGRVMVTGLVVWMVRLVSKDVSRVRGIAMVLACIVVGVESGSRTALGVGGLMLGVFVIVHLISLADPELIPVKGLVVSVFALVAVLCVTNLRLLLGVVGSDYSLTGRAGIWSAVWHAIHLHPWAGYGFSAFWRGAQEPSYAVFRAAGTVTPHAHNGYLDLLLALGAIGLVTFVIAFVVVWRRALVQLHTAEGSARIFPLVYLSLFALYNITESSLVSGRALEWILFTAVAGAVAKDTSQVRARRRSSDLSAPPAVAEQP